MLVASDYYATSEFMNDMDFSEISDLDNIGYWNKFYEETSLLKSIRKYQKTKYPLADEELNTIKDNEMKKFYKKMKRLYALPDMRTEEEKEYDFGEAFS